MGLYVLNCRSLRTNGDVLAVDTPNRTETDDSATRRLASLRCFLTAVRRSLRVTLGGDKDAALFAGGRSGAVLTCVVEETA